MVKDKRRIILLSFAYIFALVATILFIIYLCKDGLRNTTNKNLKFYIDVAMVLAGVFFFLKGFADRINSYRVSARDRHFWWMMARIEICAGIIIFLIGVIFLIIHIVINI